MTLRGQIDDRQPLMGERQTSPGVGPHPAVIRTAMRDCLAHRARDRRKIRR